MRVDRQDRPAVGIRFSISNEGREVGPAYLYIMTNDLHEAPFGLLEDVYVGESRRGSGLGTALVKEVVATATAQGCYKLIATSRTARPKVHELYERLGFTKHGVEFPWDLTPTPVQQLRSGGARQQLIDASRSNRLTRAGEAVQGENPDEKGSHNGS